MNSDVNKPFLIVNASAGSGKTYNLVRNYLRLLLSENDDRAEISQIMAMTFTNKASIEMKSRIMSDLNKLANGKEEANSYLEEIAGFVGTTPESIRSRARVVLRKILHQYEDFNVMTIDNFKGDSLTLKLTTNRMKYAVCSAKPKSCDENYPFDN